MKSLKKSDSLALTSLAICASLILFRFFHFHPTDWRLLIDFPFIRSGNTLFFFGWNLILAALPYLFIRLAETASSKIFRYTLTAFWLLFLPNAPYVISDVIHLRPRAHVPYWYDVLTFASCMGTGLLLGGWAVLAAARSYGWRSWSSRNKWLSGLLFPLCGFGIYLGRVLRWNSWDLLTRPMAVFQDIGSIMTNKVAMFTVCIYGLAYGLVLLLGVVATKKAAKVMGY
ncbi:hypothetical protein CEQ90_11500 [Lewinellaceae bacterium SD302]|nr:hypothetical protein CEQ90_11500 [Lewinellaceae bacterium SD302]